MRHVPAPTRDSYRDGWCSMPRAFFSFPKPIILTIAALKVCLGGPRTA